MYDLCAKNLLRLSVLHDAEALPLRTVCPFVNISVSKYTMMMYGMARLGPPWRQAPVGLGGMRLIHFICLSAKQDPHPYEMDFLVCSNSTNDNFKGMAALFGGIIINKFL